ncbi:MAG TPA: tetratricopeptide repeat protein [Stellaceae bacterium]|nr:tetratricopeptide repeat protein [Stellaceae bacterium]
MATVQEVLGTALAHHRRGEIDQAEALYKFILARQPRNPDALHLLGMAAHQGGRHMEAISLIQQAIASNSGVAEYHDHLGVVLIALGRYEEAINSLRHTLGMDQRRPNTWIALGRAQMNLSRVPRALESFKTALELDPENVDALSNLGVCYYEMERLEEAKEKFQAALQRNPAVAAIWNNMGAIQIEQGDADASVEAYEEAIRRDPSYSQAYCNRLMNEQYRPTVAPEKLLELSRGWDERYSPKPAPKLAPRPRNPGEPIRVGFVSPDLCRAPVGYFVCGLLRNLDRRGFTTLVYSTTPRLDDLSADIKRHVNLWRDVRAFSDDRLLMSIRADGVDVLFDLAGHTKGNRLRVFARRGAPVQVTWAGYVGTTGVGAMDYILADRYQIPESDERFYTERVLRMPNDYVCYEPPPYSPVVGPLPAERNGHVTFGGFHNVGKSGALSVATWARVLHAVPDARLILAYKKLNDPVVATRLRRRFAEAGIPEARVIIEGSTPHWQLLNRYNDVDIGLDSRPYSGGLTTLEAMWMGVPVVTVPGRTFAGRHSLSHLSNAGLADLVAEDEDGYVRLAAELARDRKRLAELRRGLRPRLVDSALLDPRRFARDFSEMVRGIVKSG